MSTCYFQAKTVTLVPTLIWSPATFELDTLLWRH